MQYVHIKNLEKYHPGYLDRKLIWAKIHFDMVHGDPDCEMINNEIDWSRLIKFIILELQAQQPIPISDSYLIRKGFNLSEREIALTLQALQPFIKVCNEDEAKLLQGCNVEKSRVKIEEDKDKSRVELYQTIVNQWNVFCEKHPSLSKVIRLTDTRCKKIKARTVDDNFKQFDKMLNAIEKQPFLFNGNSGSKEHENWRVNFDWLIENDTNYVKVLEMKYLSKGDVVKKTSIEDMSTCYKPKVEEKINA